MYTYDFENISYGARTHITEQIQSEFSWRHPGDREDLIEAVLSGDEETINRILDEESEHEKLRRILNSAESSVQSDFDGQTTSTRQGYR